MSIIIKENGRAAMMIVFCKAVSPLTDSNISAMVDWITPHVSLTLLGGVSDPLVDCIPRTNVAESADVIKNDAINKIATKEIIKENGMVLNISKIVSSVERLAKSATPLFCISIAVVPKDENQIAPKRVGTSNTPIINSRMVLPLETRAMNMLTNGAQDIHQAQ